MYLLIDASRPVEGKRKEKGEQQSAAVTFSSNLLCEGHSVYKKGSFKPKKKNPTSKPETQL